MDGQPSKPRMATNRVHRPQHREHLPRAISLSCAVPDWELDRRGRYFRFAGDSGILLLDALKSLIYEATVPRQEK